MNGPRFTMLLVLVGALLGGCATTMSPTQMVSSQRIEPHQKLTHGANEIQVHYALGKYHLAAGRFALAREEFLRALSLDATNAEVRNGLASAYVRLDDLDRAIEQLDLAIQASPDGSHLQSNLGYALMLKGHHREAATALHRAMTLDPENDRARENWLSLQAKVNGAQSADASPVAEAVAGSPQTAQEAGGTPVATARASQQVLNLDFDQPVATLIHTVRFDPAESPMTVASAAAPSAAMRATSGPTVVPGNPAPHAPERSQANPRFVAVPVRVGAEGMVQRISLRAKETAVAMLELSSARRTSRVEVSNGNGVGRLATRVTQQLRSLDLRVASVTNADRFTYPTTRIYFREGHAAAAIELSRMLPVKVELVASTSRHMGEAIDIRMVVGGDLSSPAQIDLIRLVPQSPIAGDSALSRG